MEMNTINVKPKVAFICVHNSCRSQIAEALGKKLASDVFESYSAGTEIKDHIKPDAAISMGCNVGCPITDAKMTEDWGLEDPSGKSDAFFKETIRQIEEKVLDLKKRLS